MNKIFKLPALEAQKIAAGEVVERPANIIKELIENSIDAQAQSISIYLQDAGKKLIRIIDDGHGMSSSDAQLCFQHHATSKIRSIDDLETLKSFGFRGEALASICAVSKAKLVTKNNENELGTCVELAGGEILKTSTQTHQTGTQLIIEDIFYNVPARKKFLKTDATELRAIINVFQAFCFDYLHLNFTLYHQSAVLFRCPKVTHITHRIRQLWKAYEAEHMLELPLHNERAITIKGVISDHQISRYDKNHIFVFVNNRLVKNTHLISAINKGYGNILPAQKQPSAIIKIELPNDQLDVNVHPRKQEIQFLHPRIIDRIITSQVAQTLANHTKKSLQLSTSANTPSIATTSSLHPITFGPDHTNHKTIQAYTAKNQPNKNNIQQAPHSYSSLKNDAAFPPTKSIEYKQSTATKNAPAFYTIFGQLHKTYIIVQAENGLMLIDQHAAHERILYEQFKKKFGTVASVQLIFPQMIKLSSQETQIAIQHLHMFKNHGIHIDQLHEHTFTLRAVPVFLKQANMASIITDIIHIIKEEGSPEEISKTIHEQIHAQMACKAAVKAGDELSKEKMNQLLHELESTENRSTCPHGRPTTWTLLHSQIERTFKRKV